MHVLKGSHPIVRKTAIGLAVAAALSGANAASSEELEAIVVTATRRESSVLDVPHNISAFSGETLESLEIRRVAEFVRIVPGLSFNDVGLRQAGNNNTLVMRGLSVESEGGAGEIPNLARPTVSTYVGETPVYYNLRLTDVDRIEVLRGPQGTLYGSGSLGGTLRIIPRRPEVGSLSANINAGVSSTADADDLGYDIDGMLNLPIGGSAALRITAGHSEVAGFIDAIGLGIRDADGAFVLEDPDDFVGSAPDLSGTQEDSNDGEVNHVRAALLWEISDSVDALLSLHYQDSQTDNYQAVTPGADREISWKGLNPFESELQLGSLELTADLGFATLTSATSYYETKVNSQVDASNIYQDNFASFYFYYPRISTVSDYSARDESFVQELRLTSNGGGRIDWIAGAFYLDQDMQFDTVQFMPGYDAWFEASGLAAYFGTPSPLTNPADLVYQQDRTTTFTETALFGEMTVHATESLQFTFGARWFEQEIGNDDTSILPTCFNTLDSIGIGYYCGIPPLGGSSNRSSDKLDDHIFKFNSMYELNDSTRVYFTWSQGFRNGGVNALPTIGFVDDSVGGAFPDVNSFLADKVDNWEIGLKGALGGGSAQYSVAAFMMDWSDPQARISGALSGIDGVGNSTADAQTQGIELEFNGRIGQRWNYWLGYTYTDAEFKEDGELYTTAVQDGDKLPGHSQNMASGSLTYTYPLQNEHQLQFNVSGFYRSDFENALAGSRSEFHLDSYSIWDANVSYGTDRWVVRLFGKNLGDEDAISSASLLSRPPGTSANRLIVAMPRTIGLSVTYRYE